MSVMMRNKAFWPPCSLHSHCVGRVTLIWAGEMQFAGDFREKFRFVLAFPRGREGRRVERGYSRCKTIHLLRLPNNDSYEN